MDGSNANSDIRVYNPSVS